MPLIKEPSGIIKDWLVLPDSITLHAEALELQGETGKKKKKEKKKVLLRCIQIHGESNRNNVFVGTRSAAYLSDMNSLANDESVSFGS